MQLSFSHDHVYMIRGEDSSFSHPMSVVRSMVSHMANEEGVDAKKVFDEVWRREIDEMTAIGRGLAIPHARTDKISHPCMCIATLSDDINWFGKPVRLIALSLVPYDRPDIYLQFMSALIRWRLQWNDKEWHSLTPERLFASILTIFH